MSTAPDLATRLRAWEDADEPCGFVVRLPLPTSANDLHKPVIRRTKTGKQYAAMVKTAAYEAWIKAAGQLLGIDSLDPVRGRVAVSIVLVPNTTKRDADNCIKATLDLLCTHGLLDDDTVKTVIRIQVDVWPDNAGLPIKPGEMQVRVRGLPDAAE